jgi:hypothetical protein
VFDASFQPSRLETLKTRNSAAYKGLHVLTLRAGAKDLFYKAAIQELDLMGESLDIHHIFPSSWCQKNKIPSKIYDSAVNKTPISSKANKKIGGNAPSKYIPNLQKDKQVGLTDHEMDQLLESHLIEPGALRFDDFYSFIKSRSLALLKIIYGAMAKGDVAPDNLALFNLNQEDEDAAQIALKIEGGESEMVEFKSTLRWNVNKGGVDKKMENIIIKSIAALSNRYGGALFIGVREVGAKAEVIGLDLDYQTLHEPNKDQFEVHLRNLINSAYGINFATSNIDIKFPTINDNEFCLIDVKRGSEPLYTDTQSPHPNVPSTELFYVRSGNTSQQLPIEEAAIYIANRFSLNS